jgi:hypothetical protein
MTATTCTTCGATFVDGAPTCSICGSEAAPDHTASVPAGSVSVGAGPTELRTGGLWADRFWADELRTGGFWAGGFWAGRRDGIVASSRLHRGRHPDL